jgi:hypothetical protein
VSNDVTPKIDALLDAFDSDEGINLMIQALGDPVREVRETAHWLLTETNSEAAEQALRSYPYAQMQLLHTITGSGWGENYFAISTDKKALLSNCHSEPSGYAIATVNVWSLQTGELTDTLYVRHEHLGIGQDGQIIVTSFQHIIDVWKNWEMGHRSSQIFGWIDIGSLAVSNDGSIVTCGERRPRPESLGQITVWDWQKCQVSFDSNQRIKKSKLQKILSGTHLDSQAVQPTHILQWQPIRSSSRLLTLMISPDNSLLLSQDNDRLDRHRLWNLQTGELIRVFETSPYWFADAIANTSSGNCIVSGIRDNSIKVWDLNTDQVIYSFPGYHPVSERSPTAMTPDGRVLAYCNETNGIVLWNLEVNQEIHTLPENSSPIRAICLSSDREWVVSYDADQTIKIYGLLEE